MDQRLTSYLRQPIDARPAAWAGGRGLARGDGLLSLPAEPAPLDTDDDGIPDDWESSHQLDPRTPSNNEREIVERGGARISGCRRGYTALECYLNELADRLR